MTLRSAEALVAQGSLPYSPHPVLALLKRSKKVNGFLFGAGKLVAGGDASILAIFGTGTRSRFAA